MVKDFCVDMNLRVNNLIDLSTRRWNVERLNLLFYPADVSLILANQHVVRKEDLWVWFHNKCDDYSVKSGYWLVYRINIAELIREEEALPSFNDLKNHVWLVKTSPKIKTFLWRIISGILPGADLIISRGIKADSRCQIYGLEGESSNHNMFTCSLARQVWTLSQYSYPQDGFNEESVYANIFTLFSNGKNKNMPLENNTSFPWILWYMWKNRNNLLFEGKVFLATETVEKIREKMSMWFLSQERDENSNINTSRREGPKQIKWKTPDPWLKYNIGVTWDKKNFF